MRVSELKDAVSCEIVLQIAMSKSSENRPEFVERPEIVAEMLANGGWMGPSSCRATRAPQPETAELCIQSTFEMMEIMISAFLRRLGFALDLQCMSRFWANGVG
jgi:hypothetical protein